MKIWITDHLFQPDRQGQWVTNRCDLCGEPKDAHADEYDLLWIVDLTVGDVGVNEQ